MKTNRLLVSVALLSILAVQLCFAQIELPDLLPLLKGQYNPDAETLRRAGVASLTYLRNGKTSRTVTFDRDGRPVTVTSGVSVRRWFYDSLGRISRTSSRIDLGDARGVQTVFDRYDYDSLGRLVQIVKTNENGAEYKDADRWRRDYDSTGLSWTDSRYYSRTQLLTFLGRTDSAADGSLVRTVYGDQDETIVRYDGERRLVEYTITDSGRVLRRSVFVYGRCRHERHDTVWMRDGSLGGISETLHDSCGRTLTSRQMLSDTAGVLRHVRSDRAMFDERGNPLEIVELDGDNCVRWRRRYTYDRNGLVLTLSTKEFRCPSEPENIARNQRRLVDMVEEYRYSEGARVRPDEGANEE